MRIIARPGKRWQAKEIYASCAEKLSKSAATANVAVAVAAAAATSTELRGNGSNGSICHANCVRDKSCQLNYNVCMQRWQW